MYYLYAILKSTLNVSIFLEYRTMAKKSGIGNGNVLEDFTDFIM